MERPSICASLIAVIRLFLQLLMLPVCDCHAALASTAAWMECLACRYYRKMFLRFGTTCLLGYTLLLLAFAVYCS